MPWPIPEAKEIAASYAGSLEAKLIERYPDIDPLAISRAVRSEKGVEAMLGRATALELRQVHDHLSWWGRQYFPDTAEDEFTLRHGGIWDVERRPATKAVGFVKIEGVVGTQIPADIVFSDAAGNRFTNPASAEIGDGGTVDVSVTAQNAGVAGNLEADIRLAKDVGIAGVSRIVVGEEGINGGAAEESPEEHTAAILKHIRQRPHGGAGFDYPFWLSRQFDVRAVNVLPGWIGRGSVGVCVVMKEGLFGRAPIQAELDAMADYLGRPNSKTGVRPVTAHVIMIAGQIQEVPLDIRLRPDTVATRAAIDEAWTRFLATVCDEDDEENDGPIGALLEPSRVTDALSDATGEYAHDLISPAAPLQLGDTAYPVPGPVSFGD